MTARLDIDETVVELAVRGIPQHSANLAERREIIARIGYSRSAPEIAEILGVWPRTVERRRAWERQR